MFVLLTRGKEKSIISTPSTRKANKNKSTKSHSLSDSPLPLTLEVQVSVIFTKTTNYETLKTILFAEKISGSREGFGGGGDCGDHTYGYDRVSVQVDDLKWFWYNLLEFSLPLACVAGAKREGGWGEKGNPLSPTPPPFFPSSQSPILLSTHARQATFPFPFS